MQPDLISLMQQLVTAVQSIALSVDVISVDLRALNKNVFQLMKKECSEEVSALTLAPECNISQDDEVPSPAVVPSRADQMTDVESIASHPSVEYAGASVESQQKSSEVQGSLPGSLRKATEMAASMDMYGGSLDGENGKNEEQQFSERSSLLHMIGLPPSPPHLAIQDTAIPSAAGDGDGSESKVGQLPLKTEQSSALLEGWQSTESAGETEGRKSMLGHEQGASGNEQGTPGVMNAWKTGPALQCEWCGRDFADRFKLERHRRVHTGEKPFVCPQCGKAFGRKDRLTLHRRVHSGERRYYCTICAKGFKYSQNLKKHKAQHGAVDYQGMPT